MGGHGQAGLREKGQMESADIVGGTKWSRPEAHHSVESHPNIPPSPGNIESTLFVHSYDVLY